MRSIFGAKRSYLSDGGSLVVTIDQAEGLDISKLEAGIHSFEGAAGNSCWAPRLLLCVWLEAASHNEGVSQRRQAAVERAQRERVQRLQSALEEMKRREEAETDENKRAALRGSESESDAPLNASHRTRRMAAKL